MIIDKTYFTHTSIFHLDDVTGCSICELSGRTEFIVRTHDINQLGDLGVKGDYGKKYDPNNDYYDHHQTEMYREDGYMFATAGLVWKHYGKEAIVNIIEEPLSDDMIDEIHQSIDRRLMKGIDAVDADNSFKTKSYCAGGEVKVMNISEMFGYLNSDDINDNDLEFYSAKELMKKIIIKMVDFSYKYIKAKSEFYDNLNIENGVAIASKNFPWRSLVHEHNDNNKDNPIYYIIFPSQRPETEYMMFALSQKNSRNTIFPIEKYDGYEDDKEDNDFIHVGKWCAASDHLSILLKLAEHSMTFEKNEKEKIFFKDLKNLEALVGYVTNTYSSRLRDKIDNIVIVDKNGEEHPKSEMLIKNIKRYYNSRLEIDSMLELN